MHVSALNVGSGRECGTEHMLSVAVVAVGAADPELVFVSVGPFSAVNASLRHESDKFYQSCLIVHSNIPRQHV